MNLAYRRGFTLAALLGFAGHEHRITNEPRATLATNHSTANVIGARMVPMAASAAPARVSEAFGKIPLTFEANGGQVDEVVKFVSRGQGYALFLTPMEAVLSLSGPRHESATVRMQLVGSESHPPLVGVNPQVTKSNYLLGDDPRHWQTNIANYSGVRQDGVYPGVDLLYRSNQEQVEYDFVVAPGADPGQIRLSFRGADRITIGAEGELHLHTTRGDLVSHAPEVYQELGGERQTVEGHYVLVAAPAGRAMGKDVEHHVGFAVGRYDRTRSLIIDPVLSYSTFLGGGGDDRPYGIAVDSSSNTYVTGQTCSGTFPGVSGSPIQPTTGGGCDAFVTKINSTGTAIVYSTFLGGSGSDQGWGIAVDGSGNSYVVGDTSSPTFPGVNTNSIQPTPGGLSDGFVTRINASGTGITYSTYLGGSGQDSAYGIAVDSDGNAYVTGETTSSAFPGVTASSIQPTKGGVYDGFVTKIHATGTAIVYSTFLGGDIATACNGIAVDHVGNAYVTGHTNSTSFPGVTASSIQPNNGGESDGFVVSINSPGTAIVYATFLGGSGSGESGTGIVVDSAGNAYVTGATDSPTFPGVTATSMQPTYNGGGSDSFVTKINSSGTAIVYSTFLGGGGLDIAYGIAIDGVGNAYVTGFTNSTTFPGVTASSIQPPFGGAYDGFVTSIDAAGAAIAYSTFLGGSGDDRAYGIAVDGSANAFITLRTTSATFPGVTASSIQPTNGGLSDAFVARVSPDPGFFTVSPCRIVDTRNPAGPAGGPALQPLAQRTFMLMGNCAVPASAEALSINVTITQPNAAGDLRLFPAGLSLPIASTINFSAGQTRANNTIVALGVGFDAGQITVQNDSVGTVDFILDLNGYFQ